MSAYPELEHPSGTSSAVPAGAGGSSTLLPDSSQSRLTLFFMHLFSTNGFQGDF